MLGAGRACSYPSRSTTKPWPSPKKRPSNLPWATPWPTRPSSDRWSRKCSATACASYIRKGIEEGAKLVTGGPEAPDGLSKGYYVRPTVFANVKQRHDDRAGRDLRARALHHSLRGRERRDPHRERHRLRPRGRRVVQAIRSAPSASHAASAPGRSTSTAATSTRSHPSAATSSRATVASSGATASRSSSRPSRCSSEPGARAARRRRRAGRRSVAALRPLRRRDRGSVQHLPIRQAGAAG